MTRITIIHHRNGEFIVRKSLGGMPEANERDGNRFATLDEAKAHTKQLRAEAGGPDGAEIFIIDPRK
jgi:hypothetical protein